MNPLDTVEFFNLRCFQDKKGNLVPVEGNQDIPFQIKRSFYIYDVPSNTVRGFHAHKKTEQVLICINGKCKITCKDENDKVEFILDAPSKAVYVPNGIWGEEEYLTEGATLLIYCSTKFNKSDYIRDFDEFVKWRKKGV
tara:strand:+ start:17397 stop:17813 length:417 start_codon:yes stop_codon:yes gene_type:complete